MIFQSLLFCVFSLSSLAMACPDISGQFQGRCVETFHTHPEANKNPELHFEINQTTCDQLDITMTAITSGAKITDTYDMTVDKMKMLDGDGVTLYSSGMYSADNFVGVVEYVSKKTGAIATFFKTSYSVIEKSRVPHLVVDQSSINYSLQCDIPAI